MAEFDLIEVILQTKYNFLLYNAIFLLFDENFTENDIIIELIKNRSYFWFYTGDIAVITEKF